MRPLDETISLNEFAQITGLSRQTIYKRLHRGELPFIRLSNKYVFRYYDALHYKYNELKQYPLTLNDIYGLTMIIKNNELANNDKVKIILDLLKNNHLDLLLIQYGCDLLWEIYQQNRYIYLKSETYLKKALVDLCKVQADHCFEQYMLTIDQLDTQFNMLYDVVRNNSDKISCSVSIEYKQLLLDALIKDIDYITINLSNEIDMDIKRYSYFVLLIHLPIQYESLF